MWRESVGGRERECDGGRRVKKEGRLGNKREAEKKRAREQRKQKENNFKCRPKTGKGTTNNSKSNRETLTSSPLPSPPSLHPIVLAAKPTPHYGSLGFS